jgi:hypothetical protein
MLLNINGNEGIIRKMAKPQITSGLYVQNGTHISTTRRVMQMEQSNIGKTSSTSNETIRVTPTQT